MVCTIDLVKVELIGRAAELEQVRSWLADLAQRLLTICGPGGVGKTRLARSAYAAITGDARGRSMTCPDGALWVDLYDLAWPAQVAPRLAAALGMTLQPSAPMLAQVIERQRLYSTIQGRKFVKAEGWLALAAMLGCVPREVANEDLGDGTYVATVELVRMRDGAVLSRATAECGMDEPKWSSGPKFARRSMAATRATSKSCRLCFAWIMALGGYEATPLDEIDGLDLEDRGRGRSREPERSPAVTRAVGRRSSTRSTFHITSRSPRASSRTSRRSGWTCRSRPSRSRRTSAG